MIKKKPEEEIDVAVLKVMLAKLGQFVKYPFNKIYHWQALFQGTWMFWARDLYAYNRY